MPTLVVAYPGHVAWDPARGHRVTDKLRTGLVRYAEGWDGPVVLASAEAPADRAPGTGAVWVRPGDQPFETVTAGSLAEAVARSRPDLVLASLTPRTEELADLWPRTVLVAEFTPEDLTVHELSAATSPLDVARIRVGGARRRRMMERAVRTTRGVQCNGYPAFDRLGPLSPDALLFFDTRLTAELVRLAEAAGRSAPRSPATLCFSGRLIAAKGPEFAVAAAAALTAAGEAADLVVLGAGASEGALRAAATANVRFLGELAFDDDWTSFVRDRVDLMVLPHTQGDPSGTYLEAAGCGVPVVGFDNVALRSLVDRHHIGWTVPMRDQDALTDRVRRVLHDPASWSAARAHGLALMAEHHVDHEFARRIEHLSGLL